MKLTGTRAYNRTYAYIIQYYVRLEMKFRHKMPILVRSNVYALPRREFEIKIATSTRVLPIIFPFLFILVNILIERIANFYAIEKEKKKPKERKKKIKTTGRRRLFLPSLAYICKSVEGTMTVKKIKGLARDTYLHSRVADFCCSIS